jgi:hypothetical protein
MKFTRMYTVTTDCHVAGSSLTPNSSDDRISSEFVNSIMYLSMNITNSETRVFEVIQF